MTRIGWFVVGVAVGAVGASLLSRTGSAGSGRDALKGLVGAYDVVARRVAQTREDLEDLLVEVRHEKQQASGAAEAHTPPGASA